MSSSAAIILTSLKSPENFGDLILKRELLKQLIKKGHVFAYLQKTTLCPDAYTEIVNGTNCKIINSKTAFCRTFFQTLFTPSSTRYIVLSPGGAGKSIGTFFQICKRFGVLIAAKILGFKVLHLGISAEKGNAWHSLLMKWESFFKHKSGYRDPISSSTARDRGEINIVHFPDLSFLLAKQLSVYIPYEERNVSAVLTFRQSLFNESSEYDQLLEKVVTGLVAVFGAGNILATWQADRDIQFMRDLSAKFKLALQDNGSFPYKEENIWSAYRKSKYIVSNRLHTLLFGMFCGSVPIPVVNKEENTKIVGLFQDANLLDLCIFIETDLSEQQIATHFTKIEKNLNFYQNLIQDWIKKSDTTLDKVINEVFAN